MKQISVPDSLQWAREDRLKTLEADLERWRMRAEMLLHEIETAWDALQGGGEVSFAGRKGTLIVTVVQPAAQANEGQP